MVAVFNLRLRTKFKLVWKVVRVYHNTRSLPCAFAKVLYHHIHEIVCLAYSRDDRFLISVGDYRECSVVVWSTRDLVMLTASCAPQPIHDLRWDPYTANEFVSVGQNGSVLFWLLDETGGSISLNVSSILPLPLLLLLCCFFFPEKTGARFLGQLQKRSKPFGV